jgi:hypothetical protein
MVVLALCDVRADLGSTVDQAFVLQCGKRGPDSVAGDQEFGRQFQLTGQSLIEGAGVDLVTQHVGNLARAISARLANWQCYGHLDKLTPPTAA